MIYDILSFKNFLLNIFINPTAILPVSVYSDYAIYLLIWVYFFIFFYLTCLGCFGSLDY